MIKSMNIAWWVQRWAELHPDKTAIIFEEQTISYEDLCKRGRQHKLLASVSWY